MLLENKWWSMVEFYIALTNTRNIEILTKEIYQWINSAKIFVACNMNIDTE